MMKSAIRVLTAAAVLASLTGCWSMAINGKELTKPVSMSNTVGRPANVVRHFKHDLLVTWYLLGLVPMATIPGGSVPFATPADKLVAALLKNELNDGDAITNLRVTHGVTLPSFGIMVVLGIVPIVGQAAAALFSPMGVTVEGDIVRYTTKKGAVPQGPAITMEGDRLVLGEVDLNGMIREALAEGAER